MFEEKIISYHEAEAFFDKIKSTGKKIVQCHGTFDLVHPGHVYHLEEARSLGDVLVATITAEQFVNKGPGRPYFNDKHRLKAISALGCVDYVVLIPFPAAVEAIACVKPDIYCKGKEYADPNIDVAGNIMDDVATVRRYGGEIRYIGSIVFSSTKLINNFFDNVAPEIKEFCRSLAMEYPPEAFRRAVDSLADLRVLIIGDIIFDRYTATSVQGLTSKNKILSTRFIEEDMQAGGALAVFRHVKQFCHDVKLVSLLGTESWVDNEIGKYLAPEDCSLIRDANYTTIVKQRFVQPITPGKEIVKLFSVNYIDNSAPAPELSARVHEATRALIKDYDLVIVMDFGHGLMDPGLRELVQKEAKFLAVNCQTNSNNYGFNIIDRQYQRADCFALDQTEIHLAMASTKVDYSEALQSLREKLGAEYAWLTRGATNTIGLRRGACKPCQLLPLENAVTDTIGAGDAFFSVAALAACAKLPLELTTFLGQLSGGQAVNIVGNTEAISKPVLLKSGMSLLNF